MTDHQVALLAAGISSFAPMIAVIIGILINNRQLDALREEMREIRGDIREIRRDLAAVVERVSKIEGIIEGGRVIVER